MCSLPCTSLTNLFQHLSITSMLIVLFHHACLAISQPNLCRLCCVLFWQHMHLNAFIFFGEQEQNILEGNGNVLCGYCCLNWLTLFLIRLQNTVVLEDIFFFLSSESTLKAHLSAFRIINILQIFMYSPLAFFCHETLYKNVVPLKVVFMVTLLEQARWCLNTTPLCYIR